MKNSLFKKYLKGKTFIEKFTLNSIGNIAVCDNQTKIELDEKYIVVLLA